MQELLTSLFGLGSAVPAEYATAALLGVLFVATFASEDLACLAAGGLVASGRIGFGAAVAACFLGIFAGDMMLYWTGRLFAGPVFRSRLGSRFVSRRRLEGASEWLEKRGASAVFLSRFVSGFRLPTYLAAGALKADFAKFAFWFAAAAAVWTPLLVGSVAFSRKVLPSGGVIAAAIAVWLISRSAMKLAKPDFRRMLRNKFRRMCLWEFWPIQMFYAPVVFYILFLGLKHRRPTLFTAANPALPAGGFVGESKDEIYKLIARSPAAGPHMLRHQFVGKDLSVEEKRCLVRSFIEENRLSYPVVVKPDRGERGRGVVIAHSNDELAKALLSSTDLLVQEYFEGIEASLFYFSRPNENKGAIFSITEKRFPEIVGDGVSDLRSLIVRDERASLIADRYFEHNRDRLDNALRSGERVRLIDIGSHSRGAIFLEGGRLRTDALENEIDRLCRDTPGFYFGRFDLRSASFEALMAGDFKIIELNGVTSESTNIYDPRYGLLDAYRILFRQWRLAFEIGLENEKSGERVCTVRELLAVVVEGLYPASGRKLGKTATARPASQCA